MMTTAQICRIIEHGQLSDQDLTDVITAVKYARRNIQRKITLLGIVTLVNHPQLLNACSPMLVTLLGIVMLEKPQYWNA